MKYVKIRDVKSPNRGTAESAGIDFYIPTMDEQFFLDFEERNPGIAVDRILKRIHLEPSQRANIPSGVKTVLNEGRVLIAFNKSGVATKKGLDTMACVVDADYQGEVHISLLNTSDRPVSLGEGEKAVQMVELTYHGEILEINDDFFKTIHSIKNSTRGEGRWGSTGTH